MQTRVSVVGPEVDAYIITSFDEHLNDHLQEFDERHIFISGFTGKVATIAVTTKSVALWTDERFIFLADDELDCDWHIFNMNESPSIAEWLGVNSLFHYAEFIMFKCIFLYLSKNYMLMPELELILKWSLM